MVLTKEQKWQLNIMNKIYIGIGILLILISLTVSGNAGAEYGDGWQKICYDDGRCAYSNHLTYRTYNGSYVPTSIQKVDIYNGGYNLTWNGGRLQLIWDGTYAYDMVFNPDNNQMISPWTMWKVESKKVPPGTWQEEIPVSNAFVKVDNNTVQRRMVLGSGGKFNITYHNEGTRIKQDLELTAGYAREYRLTYRIDSVAAQDVNIDTKKFTPGFFNNFTIYDVTDVPAYRTNGDGAYISGFNTTASIDNTNRKYYLTISNGQVMIIGQKVYIDPSWIVGTGGNAWSGNSTKVNTTLNRDTNNIELRQQVDDYISYWRFDGSSGTIAYDENQTSNNNGTLINMNSGLNNCTGNCSGWNSSGKFGNAIAFDGVNDYVDCKDVDLINFSIAAWFKVTAFPATGYATLVGRENAQSLVYLWSYSIFIYPSALLAGGIGNGTIGVYDANVMTLSNNVWYYVVMTYDKTTIRFYVNGIYHSEDNIGTSITPVQSANPLKLGKDGSTYFNGSIDEVRIYNSALTNDEINLTMNQSKYYSGYIKTWYDAGTDNEIYQVSSNGTFDANSNQSGQYAQNGSSPSGYLSPENQTVNYTWATVPSYQHTDWYTWLFGNGTATPKISTITMWMQAVPPTIPDTSFTLSFPIGQIQAFFNATNKSSKDVPPNGQNSTSGFLYIIDTGNVDLYFYGILNASSPAGAILKGNISNISAGAPEINTTLNKIISTAIIPTNSQYVWLWVDYSNALPMSEQRNLSVNSSQT